MINKILIIFLATFSSCSLIEYDDIVPITRQVLFGTEEVEIDQDLLASQGASIARINIGRSESYLLTLQRINAGYYYWRSSSLEGVTIITNRFGKILSTHNLKSNISVIKDNFSITDKSTLYNVMLLDPTAVIEQEALITSSYSSDNNLILKELIYNKVIKSSWENVYIIDNNNLPIKTTQKIHPNLGKIEMDFFFKL